MSLIKPKFLLFMLLVIVITVFTPSNAAYSGAVNRTTLRARIQFAKSLIESNFTPESWEPMMLALHSARSIYNWPDSTQYMINNELNTLNARIAGLVPVYGVQLPPDNSGIYARLDRIHDIIYESSANTLSLQYWQVGLLSFSAGIKIVLIFAFLWGRLS